MEFRTYHLNHFQVSGISRVFCNSLHVFCRSFCRWGFWCSLKQIFEGRKLSAKNLLSISVQFFKRIYSPLGEFLLVYRLFGSGLQLRVRWTERHDCPHLLLHPRVQGWKTATHRMTIFGTGSVGTHHRKIKCLKLQTRGLKRQP